MEIEINSLGENPVITINGRSVGHTEGIIAILQHKQWTREDMAHYLKVSVRTVQGWVNGRKPSNSVLMALSFMVV